MRAVTMEVNEFSGVGGGQVTLSELISGPGSVDTTLAAAQAAAQATPATSATTQPATSDPFAAPPPPVYASPIAGSGKGYSVQVINGGVVSEVTFDAPDSKRDDLARARGSLPAQEPATYGLPRSGPQKH
jgi:hypothetical protein